MAKIIGGTTATPIPVADWKQTNPNRADYIKNKPFEEVDEALNFNSTNPIQNKAVSRAIGDIDAALDHIIAIQNELIGGGSV